MWRGVALSGVCALLVPGTVTAAQIYGRLTRDGAALPAGAQVSVSCRSGDSANATTDAQGRYSLFISSTGRCTLTLPGYRGASAEIASFQGPVGFSFEIVALPDGSFALRRP